MEDGKGGEIEQGNVKIREWRGRGEEEVVGVVERKGCRRKQAGRSCSTTPVRLQGSRLTSMASGDARREPQLHLSAMQSRQSPPPILSGLRVGTYPVFGVVDHVHLNHSYNGCLLSTQVHVTDLFVDLRSSPLPSSSHGQRKSSKSLGAGIHGKIVAIHHWTLPQGYGLTRKRPHIQKPSHGLPVSQHGPNPRHWQ